MRSTFVQTMARLAREANPRYLTVVQVDRFYAGQV